LTSWWIRRPKGRFGIPGKRVIQWSVPLVLTIIVMCVILPIFGLSVLVIAAVDRLIGARATAPISRSSIR